MSREIRFRAWDSSIKKMRYFNEFWLDNEYQSLAWKIEKTSKTKDETSYCLDCEQEDLTLMQFTGLHDKNGKEIWEGDIVLTFDPAHAKPMPMKIVYDVSPYCGFFKESVDCLRKVMLTNDIYCNTEVLGNIYENPELLTP